MKTPRSCTLLLAAATSHAAFASPGTIQGALSAGPARKRFLGYSAVTDSRW